MATWSPWSSAPCPQTPGEAGTERTQPPPHPKPDENSGCRRGCSSKPRRRQGSPGQAGPRARRGRRRGHRGLLPLPPRGRLSPRLAWVRGQPLSPSCPLLRPRGVSRRGYHSHIVSSAWVGLGSQSSAPGDAVWHVKPTQCEQRWIQPAAGERASNGSINPTPPAEPPGDPGSHVGPAGELRRGALGRLGRAAPDGATRTAPRGCERAPLPDTAPGWDPAWGQLPRLPHWTQVLPSCLRRQRWAKAPLRSKGSTSTSRRTRVGKRQRAGCRTVPPLQASRRHPNPGDPSHWEHR